MKREQKAYSVLRTSCIRIQSHWRGVQVRKAVAKMHKAAVIIQTSFRGQIARDYYRCLKELVIRCQLIWRAKIKARRERSEFLRQKAAVTLIQTTFRNVFE
jgi:abnormal spindle-like microcephaly-associated protein